ncbi:MAG: phosphoenolpyruvate synthase [Candidatus Gracilibacteria bacterium]|jgi:pyruvate,water dikinase
MAKNILWFDEIGIENVPEVGGKNASLGEMTKAVVKKGVNVPFGFATTAEAYFYFLSTTGLDKKIAEILKDLDVHDLKQLAIRGKQVRELIKGSELPKELSEDVLSAYKKLSEKYGSENTDVAVRSSATAEDLPGASFAGQQETYLNITGPENVLLAVRKCFASLFTDRAIVYRQEMGFEHTKVGLSAGVQKMVRSDLGASGVMFSCDTESGFGDVVLINASYGLGENVVLGRVEPDQYYVFETTLKKGFKPIIEKKVGSKLIKMVYTSSLSRQGGIPLSGTKNIATTKKERENFVLNNEEILTFAKWAMIIEEHYKKSMDMEWAKDGRDGKLYIVQARPETVQSRKNLKVLENYVLQSEAASAKASASRRKIVAEGMSVGSKIGSGKANKIMDAKNIADFKKGEILVTGMTDPDWVPAMKLASAIITDAGGRTAHAAIVSRELGIPCIVGAGNATKVIKTGTEVTVDCSQGEEGKVYEGIIPFEIKKTDISNIEKTKTKILMNVGEPSNAFNLSFIPNDGVGLAREEFIIVNSIKAHPNALINYPAIAGSRSRRDKTLKKKIDAISLGYDDKVQFYIDKLAEGIGTIGAAFYPKPVIVRFSDFKTNEYRTLLGGEEYEPLEENPMIGFRGASRYYDKKFKDAFVLECKAMKKVRDEFGLSNVIPMIPFCRTLDEGKKVVQIMAENGLKQVDGLKIYVMCEIPANVILAEKFLEIFDGFSIGSNDLTQLTLGLDRDNSEIASVGNEKNEAVKELIEEAIKVCQNNNKYIGICGQGPSDFPDFAQFLVELGIESISLNPDSVLKTKIAIAETERKLNQTSIIK